MDQRYIQEFVTLAEIGNYSDAADKLFISQSTLSKHIIVMEEELGVALFNRDNKRSIRLTDAGHIMLKYGKEFLRLKTECDEALRLQINKNARSLTVATPPELIVYNIMDIIVHYMKNTMGYTIDILEDDPLNHLELLHSGKCELVMTRTCDRLDPDICCHCSLDDPMYLVMAATHPLAAQHEVSLEALKDTPFLLHKSGTALRQLSVDMCQSAGFQPKVIYDSHRPSVLIDFAARGVGVALMCKYAYEAFSDERVTAALVVPETHQRFCLCSLKKHALSPAALYFIKCTKHIWYPKQPT